MTVSTVYARLADRDGIAQFDTVHAEGRAAVRTITTTAAPAANFRREQPSVIPIDIGHDGQPVGELVYLERTDEGGLWGVGILHDFDPDVVNRSAWYWSVSLAGHRAAGSLTYERIVAESVSITTQPASIGLIPLQALPGDLREPGVPSTWPLGGVPMLPMVRRAAEYVRAHRAGAPIVIADPAGITVERLGISLVLVNGEPLANRATTAPTRPTAESVPIRFAHLGGQGFYVIDSPPSGRSTTRKAKLLWQDGEIAGSYLGEVGDRGLAFKATDTTAGREALALTEDGVIDAAVPRRLPGGQWSTLQLVVT